MEKQSDIYQFLQKFGFVCGCILVPVAVLGVILNCLTVFIFTRPSMRSWNLHVLLIGLSVASCIYVMCDTPLFAAIAFYSQENETLDKLTVLMMIYVYPVAMMAQTASIWCLVAVSATRFSEKVKNQTNTAASYMLLPLIIIGSVAYNFCRFWEYTVDDDKKFQPGTLQQNPHYVTYYMRWLYFICMFLVPFCVIITSDIGIIILLFRKQGGVKGRVNQLDNDTDKITGTGRKSSVENKKGSSKDELRHSIVVVALGFVFVFFHSLAFAINALEIGQRSKACSQQKQEEQQYLFSEQAMTTETTEVWSDPGSNHLLTSSAGYYYNDYNEELPAGQHSVNDECVALSVRFLISVDVSNVLVQVNCVTNFFVYLIFSTKFRRAISRLLSHERNNNVDGEDGVNGGHEGQNGGPIVAGEENEENGEAQTLVDQQKNVVKYRTILHQQSEDMSITE